MGCVDCVRPIQLTRSASENGAAPARPWTAVIATNSPKFCIPAIGVLHGNLGAVGQPVTARSAVSVRTAAVHL